MLSSPLGDVAVTMFRYEPLLINRRMDYVLVGFRQNKTKSGLRMNLHIYPRMNGNTLHHRIENPLDLVL